MLIFGISQVGHYLIYILGALYRRFLKSNDIYSKYANSQRGVSWALVTGGSDGIGLSLCKKLARDGFNICIVSRNQQKMEDKIKEIKEQVQNDSIKYEYIVADFGSMTTVQEY